MAQSLEPEGYTAPRGDPLAAEHATVAAWIEDAVASLGERCNQEVDLKTLPSGKKLLDAKPEQARRYVHAAVAQVRHWDEKAEQIRTQDDPRRPGWDQVWGRRRNAEVALGALMRRNLPFEKPDLLFILQWCNGGEILSRYFGPIGSITSHSSATPRQRRSTRNCVAR